MVRAKIRHRIPSSPFPRHRNAAQLGLQPLTHSPFYTIVHSQNNWKSWILKCAGVLENVF